MPACPHCKQEIRADSEYCGDCGKKVSFSGSKSDAGKSPPPSGAKPAGKKGLPLLKIFFGCGCLGLILLIIIIAVLYFFFKPEILKYLPDSLKNLIGLLKVYLC